MTRNRHTPLSYGKSDPLSHAITERDRNVIQMVEDALALNRCMLAFQPIVQAQSTKSVAFYECLIRLIDATGRQIPAKDFIEVVEDTEIGRKIDCASLDLGLKALVANPTLRLAVNMSARSIGYRPWVNILETSLDMYPMIAERLILEITETSAMSMPELVIRFMHDLNQRGVSFALDDFGSGQTSFRYFKDFFFDVLKVDGQFTKDIGNNADNQVLAQALVSIGTHFEMFTVAENVENAKDAELLIGLGFDCLQGYHFGAPTVRPPWAVKPKFAQTA